MITDVERPASHHPLAVSLGDVFEILWSAKWFLFGAGAVGFIIAATMSLAMKPVYRATVVVAEAEEPATGSLSSLASQFGGLAALGGFDFGSSPNLDQSLAVMTSVPFTQKFLVREQAFPALFVDEWDAKRGGLRTGARDSATSWLRSLVSSSPGEAVSATIAGTIEDPYVLWEGFRRFDSRRSVDVDRKTHIVAVSIDAPDGTLAAQWSNDLIASLNSELRARAIEESRVRIEFLERRVASTTTVELRDALYRLVEAEQKRSLVANTRSEYALRVLSPGVPPDMRISPRRSLIAIAGGLAGGLLGLLWVILVDVARRAKHAASAS